MEVGAQAKKLLLQKTVKLGWLIYKTKDHVVANRCLKCSRFNRRFRVCRRGNMPSLRRKTQAEGVYSIPTEIKLLTV